MATPSEFNIMIEATTKSYRGGGHLSATEKLGIRLGRVQGFSINQLSQIYCVSPKTAQSTAGRLKTLGEVERLTLIELDACPTDKALFDELVKVVSRNLAGSVRRHGIAAPRGRLAINGDDEGPTRAAA